MIFQTLLGPAQQTSQQSGADVSCDAQKCVGMTAAARASLAMLQEQVNRFGAAGNFVPLVIDGVITDGVWKVAQRAAQIALGVIGGNASNELQMLAAGQLDRGGLAAEADTIVGDFVSAASTHAMRHGRGSLGDYASGTDFKCNSAICYGIGPIQHVFEELQRQINRFAETGKFKALTVDGQIGAGTKVALQKAAIFISKLPSTTMMPRALQPIVVRAMNGLLSLSDIAAQAQTLVDLFKAAWHDPDNAAVTLTIGPATVTPSPKVAASVPTSGGDLTMGRDFNCKFGMCYGIGPVQQSFIELQKQINRFVPVGIDGKIGPSTVKAGVMAAQKALGTPTGSAQPWLIRLGGGTLTMEQIATASPSIVTAFRAAGTPTAPQRGSSSPAMPTVASVFRTAGTAVASTIHPGHGPAVPPHATSTPTPTPVPTSSPAGVSEDFQAEHDYKCRPDWGVCYGVGPVHQVFVELQQQIARLSPISVDGKLGNDTLQAAIHLAQAAVQAGAGRRYPILNWVAQGPTLAQFAAHAQTLVGAFRAVADHQEHRPIPTPPRLPPPTTTVQTGPIWSEQIPPEQPRAPRPTPRGPQRPLPGPSAGGGTAPQPSPAPSPTAQPDSGSAPDPGPAPTPDAAPDTGPADHLSEIQDILTACQVDKSSEKCKAARTMCATDAAKANPALQPLCASIGEETPSWVWWALGGGTAAALLTVTYVLMRKHDDSHAVPDHVVSHRRRRRYHTDAQKAVKAA